MSSVRFGSARELNREGGRVDALINLARFRAEIPEDLRRFELMLANELFRAFPVHQSPTRPAARWRSSDHRDCALDHTRRHGAPFLKGEFRSTPYVWATKALDLMVTFELARRGKLDVRANAFHPGLVRSELMSEAPRAAASSRAWSQAPRSARRRTSPSLRSPQPMPAPPAGSSKDRDGSIREVGYRRGAAGGAVAPNRRARRDGDRRLLGPCSSGMPHSDTDGTSGRRKLRELFTPRSQLAGRMRAAVVNHIPRRRFMRRGFGLIGCW